MSEDNIDPQNTESNSDEQLNEEPQGKPEVDWKSESRKWETRAKADHEAANKWREFEASQKSEYEKLADELAKFKSEAEQASAKVLRYEVATEKGIPAEALDLLTGSSREDLEAAADKLIALIADQNKPSAPKPDMNQGKPASAGRSAADQFAAALSNLI